jgi:hypothetical protein
MNLVKKKIPPIPFRLAYELNQKEYGALELLKEK